MGHPCWTVLVLGTVEIGSGYGPCSGAHVYAYQGRKGTNHQNAEECVEVEVWSGTVGTQMEGPGGSQEAVGQGIAISGLRLRANYFTSLGA